MSCCMYEPTEIAQSLWRRHTCGGNAAKVGMRARTTHKEWSSASAGCKPGPSIRARTRTRVNVNVRPRHLVNEQENRNKQIWWRCIRVLHMSNQFSQACASSSIFRLAVAVSSVVNLRCVSEIVRSFAFLKGVLEAHPPRWRYHDGSSPLHELDL